MRDVMGCDVGGLGNCPRQPDRRRTFYEDTANENME
jgi:hypothetical protein